MLNKELFRLVAFSCYYQDFLVQCNEYRTLYGILNTHFSTDIFVHRKLSKYIFV